MEETKTPETEITPEVLPEEKEKIEAVPLPETAPEAPIEESAPTE